MHCLNLSPEIENEGAKLLEKLCMLVGDEGGEKVFLRLPNLSPVVKLARQAGFLFCTQETLYRREASPSSPSITAKFIRPSMTPDEYPIFRLYNECVPSEVKSEYALTFDQWSDAMEACGSGAQQGIYESKSCVRGWVRVGYGKRAANRLEIMVHPEEEPAVWDDLLSWSLQQGRPMTPFLSLVPDYQSTLAWVLEKKGFIPKRFPSPKMKVLKVEILQLKSIYDEKGPNRGVKVSAVLRAYCNNKDQTYRREYRERLTRYPIAPTSFPNETLVNASLSGALKKMFSDDRLLKCLAH